MAALPWASEPSTTTPGPAPTRSRTALAIRRRSSPPASGTRSTTSQPSASLATRPASSRGQALQPGHAQALQLPLGVGQRLQPAPQLLGGVLGPGLEQGRHLGQELALAVDVVQRLEAGQGLDPAQVGPDRGLAEHVHRPDLAAVADVGAAAQLAGEVADLDHPDHRPVLLAEQRERPGRLGLGQAAVPHRHVRVGQELAVDGRLDLGQPLGRDRLEVGEVEAQPAGVDQRALLAGVLAQLVAERPVEGVGGGVAAGHRRRGGRRRPRRGPGRRPGAGPTPPGRCGRRSPPARAGCR